MLLPSVCSISLSDPLRPPLEKNDESLTVSLGDDPPEYYFPGQMLSGWVGCRERLENGEATVTIQLAGSSRVKITDARVNTAGQRSTDSSSEEHEFAGLGDQICIFKGPIQDVLGAAEDQHWAKFPFTITIPKEPFAPHHEHGENEKQGHAAASSENTPVVLPASFEIQYVDMSRTADVNVTYRLDAKLSVEPGRSWTAHLPLKLRTVGPKPNPNCYIRRLPTRVVKSPRLVPGHENASIGLRSKAKKLFGSSKIPAFAFGLILRSPIDIALDDGPSNSFPFQVEAKPDWSRSSESIAETIQKPTVKGFKLDLVTKAHMSANSPSPRSFSTTESLPLVDFTQGDASWKPHPSPNPTQGIATVLKRFSDENHGDVPPPAAAVIDPLVVRLHDDPSALDLGRKFLCRLDTKTPLGSRLTAGFVLPNVRFGHFVRWKLTVELAGEEFIEEGEQTVAVLNPPAESVYY